MTRAKKAKKFIHNKKIQNQNHSENKDAITVLKLNLHSYLDMYNGLVVLLLYTSINAFRPHGPPLFPLTVPPY